MNITISKYEKDNTKIYIHAIISYKLNQRERKRGKKMKSNKKYMELFTEMKLNADNNEKPIVFNANLFNACEFEKLDNQAWTQYDKQATEKQVELIEKKCDILVKANKIDKNRKNLFIEISKKLHTRNASTLIRNLDKMIDVPTENQIKLVERYLLCPNIDKPSEEIYHSFKLSSDWIKQHKNIYDEWRAKLPSKKQYDEYKYLFYQVHGYNVEREVLAFIDTEKAILDQINYFKKLIEIDNKYKYIKTELEQDISKNNKLLEEYNNSLYQNNEIFDSYNPLEFVKMEDNSYMLLETTNQMQETQKDKLSNKELDVFNELQQLFT